MTMGNKEGYKTVSLPNVLADVAEKMIKTGKYGYRLGSGALVEYICDIMRRDLREKGFIK